jgi:hypothetical protein
MHKPGGCSTSSGRGGSGGGGPSGGEAKDLPQLLLRVGAAVALSVAGLLVSRRERPPRQLLLPPRSPSSGTSHEKIYSACYDAASIVNCVVLWYT